MHNIQGYYPGILYRNSGSFSKMPSCPFVLVSLCPFPVIIDHQKMSLDVPAWVQKELDTVLTLQATLEIVKQDLKNTCVVVTKGSALDMAITLSFEGLKHTYSHLKKKVEGLYTSLNITDISFANVIGLEALHFLILACDLKINIWKRAMNVFCELERLNQASGGQEHTLGTKLHQQVRGTISRQRPALMASNSINMSNSYKVFMKSLGVCQCQLDYLLTLSAFITNLASWRMSGSHPLPLLPNRAG